MDNKSPDTDTSASGPVSPDDVDKPPDSPDPSADSSVSTAGYVFWVIMLFVICCPILGVLLVISSVSSKMSSLGDFLIWFFFLLPFGIYKSPF